MAGHCMRRISKEIADIRADSHSQIKAEPFYSNDDITHLRGYFPGPPGTPYAGGTYSIDIKIPTDYPFCPPTMRFETKVWHPNISSQTVSVLGKKHLFGNDMNINGQFRVQFAWTLSLVPGHQY